ncbi:MAG: DNA polymerase III subunit delta' [Candidatus Omnitrophota bacterium]
MSFEEILGQEHVVRFLRSAIRENRLAHAYLFIGPPGVGKTQTAVSFAGQFLCQSSQTGQACGQCPSCVKVQKRAHPDLLWLAPEGQFIKIDAIREACRRLSLKGFESSRKILVVSDAEALHEESSNALLKTLEEPTPETVLILLATTLENILPTIASRCQKVFFSSLSQEHLEKILKEKYHQKGQALTYFVRIAQGSPGVAGHLVAGRLFERKNSLIDAALDSKLALSQFLSAMTRREDAPDEEADELLLVLSTWFRDLLLAKFSSEIRFLINADRAAEIQALAGDFSVAELEERLSAIADVAVGLEHNANRRIALGYLRGVLWK